MLVGMSASTTTVRLDTAVRDELLAVAENDFGGATANEAIRRLIAEHWENKAVAAMDNYRVADPDGWQAYVNDADSFSRQAAPALGDDPWEVAA